MNKLNKQTEQSQTKRWRRDNSWLVGFRGGGVEQKRKRTHGQQCGDCWNEAGIRGLNGNGNIQQKQTNKK